MSRIHTVMSLSMLLGALIVPAQAQEKERNSIHVPDDSQDDGSAPGEKAHTHRRQLIGTAGGLGPKGGMSPEQMRSFYSLPAYDISTPPTPPAGGWGAIAIVDAYDYPTALNDFNVFSTKFKLPTQSGSSATSDSNTVFQVVYQGDRKPKSNGGWAQEAALDIQWAHAMSPGAKIYLVEAQSNSFANLMAAVDTARVLAGVKQVSLSWGGNEFSSESAYDIHFPAGGPLIFASSGDVGGVTSYPAVSTNVVAVGGTSVATDNAGVLTSETGWKDGGGGPSKYYQRPPWQNAITTTGSARGTPDLSSNADPNTGVAVYDSTSYRGMSGWLVFGGTSVSAPCMAGMVNLSGLTYTGGTPGFLQAIYSSFASNFRDIDTGNNGFPCLTGWDFVTGVGSPQGTGF